jgi:hypothetical protein
VRALLDTKRMWLPFVAAAICLLGSGMVGPVLAWVLIMASFGFVLDGATIMYPKGDKLTKYRQ